jgi:hypothetical protein
MPMPMPNSPAARAEAARAALGPNGGCVLVGDLAVAAAVDEAEVLLDELQADFEDLTKRGLVLDCDPRKMTQAGQAQTVPPAGGVA